ncbi:MAG TPA: amylo-alpha-1,6-glucosidase [Candidatus Polarisedimenticolaceae bacterium]
MTITFDSDTLSNFEDASRREWIEPNGLGGWASSSLSGANTRRYHGLLVAATRPPVGRMVLLSKLDATIVRDGERFELGSNRWPGAVWPEGHKTLQSFERDLFPVFVHEAGGVRLRKTVAAIHGENTTVVVYEVLEAAAPFVLELRPFVAGRDHHALVHANPFVRAEASFEAGVLAMRPYDGVPEVFVSAARAEFTPGADWYRSFEYDFERERGLDFREDLFTYGVLRRELHVGDRFGVVISTANPGGRDAWKLLEAERKRRKELVAAVPEKDALRRALILAADGFVVRRGESRASIVAGYPWFSDWGRDAMIALPGLTLATGRFDDARKVLLAFRDARMDGLIPNRFGERAGEAEYNAADATLWMFVAVHEYLKATGDLAFVTKEMLPALREVIEHHERGTRHGIRVDAQGLLYAGEAGTNLTWMDAKLGDHVFTPRVGRAVEVNALWCNALAILSDFEKQAGNEAESGTLARKAKKAKAAFVKVFWNEEAGYLLDVDDHVREASIRPNALIALSLPFALLSKEQAKRLLDVVEEKLLTPVGLRSLAPGDPAYRPVYQGGPAERDAAYHQGTVWLWLLGPYVNALLRTQGAAGKAKAAKLFDALPAHLAEGCVGQLSEIFDGEPPHAARGCPAQAWSVAEVLRAWTLVESRPSASKKKPYRIVPVKAEGKAKSRKKAKGPEAQP